MPLTKGIGYQLRRTYLSLHRAFRMEIAAEQITPDQYVILGALTEEDGLSQRELGVRIYSDPNTVSGTVRRLEAKRLVSRRADATDGRSRRVFLTRRGRTMHERIAVIARRMHRRALGGLSGAESKELVRLLSLVHHALEKTI